MAYFEQIDNIQLSDNNFGEDLNSRLTAIHNNFTKLCSTPILKGVNGDSIEVSEVYLFLHGRLTEIGARVFNVLFKDISDWCKDMTQDDVIEKFSAEGLGYSTIDGVNVYDDLLDASVYMYETKEAGETTGEYQGSAQLISFIDPRISVLTSSNTYFQDYTNLISLGAKENQDKLLNTIPKIYYEVDLEDFCWMINDYKTGITCRGIQGEDGNSTDIYYVKCDGTGAITYVFALNDKNDYTFVLIDDLSEDQYPTVGSSAYALILNSESGEYNNLVISKIFKDDDGTYVINSDLAKENSITTLCDNTTLSKMLDNVGISEDSICPFLHLLDYHTDWEDLAGKHYLSASSVLDSGTFENPTVSADPGTLHMGYINKDTKNLLTSVLSVDYDKANFVGDVTVSGVLYTSTIYPTYITTNSSPEDTTSNSIRNLLSVDSYNKPYNESGIYIKTYLGTNYNTTLHIPSTKINGMLEVDGVLEVADDLSVGGTVTVDDDLSVGGTASVGGSLSVTGGLATRSSVNLGYDGSTSYTHHYNIGKLWNQLYDNNNYEYIKCIRPGDDINTFALPYDTYNNSRMIFVNFIGKTTPTLDLSNYLSETTTVSEETIINVKIMKPSRSSSLYHYINLGEHSVLYYNNSRLTLDDRNEVTIATTDYIPVEYNLYIIEKAIPTSSIGNPSTFWRTAIDLKIPDGYKAVIDTSLITIEANT